MQVRKRIVAAASAASVAAALAVGVAPSVAAGSSPGSAVSFTWQTGQVSLVDHYVVSPAGKQSPSGATEESRTIALSPKRIELNHSNVAPRRAGGGESGDNAGEGSGGTTPRTSSSFMGQQGSATTCSYFAAGCNPPDMALAAGPTFVLQGVNSQWQVTDTAGNVLPGWPVSAQNFFGVPNVTNPDGTACDTAHGSQPFLSDPRGLYDAMDHRYWAAMLQVENAFGVGLGCPFKSVYYVAVSQTSNPNGKWNVYEFDMTMGQLFAADYTQLGINGQGVYFSGNMFGVGPNGGFYAEVVEANKSRMEKGQDKFTADAFFNLQGTGPGAPASFPFLADTVQPTLNIDGSAGNTEIFADTIDGPDLLTGNLCGFTGNNDPCSGLAVWKMTNPTAHDNGGPAPTFSGTYVPTRPFLVSAPADEPTCNQCIDVLDLRLTGTPVVRDGTLYAAWETSVNNATQAVPGIEWGQFSLDELGGSDGSHTAYYNFSGDAAAAFGTLMPDSEGNLVMLFEHMGSTVNPETRYIVKPADANNFKGAGALLKAGESSYRPTLCGGAIPVCRWGDYEAASFDGAGHVWFAGEYANTFLGTTTPPAFGRNWGTWIGAIRAS